MTGLLGNEGPCSPVARGDRHLQDVTEAIANELSLPAYNQADNRMTEALDQPSPAKTSPDQQDRPAGL